MGKSGKFGTGVIALLVSAFLGTLPAFAASKDNPYLACKMGPKFANYAETLSDREAQLLLLMSKEYAPLEKLEGDQARFNVEGKVLSAVEFGVISLGVNGVIFGTVGTGLMTSMGVTLGSNAALQLRQTINMLVGSASLAWAATNHGPKEAMSTQDDLTQDPKGLDGSIEADWLAGRFGEAEKYVILKESIYAQKDIQIRKDEIAAHQAFIEEHGVTSYVHQFHEPICMSLVGPDLGTTVPGTDLCIPTQLGVHVISHAALNELKMLNPFHNGVTLLSESKGIQTDHIKSHLDLYMEERDSVVKQMNFVLETCRLHLHDLNESTKLSPAAMVDEILKHPEELPGQNPGNRAPASSNTGK